MSHWIVVTHHHVVDLWLVVSLALLVPPVALGTSAIFFNLFLLGLFALLALPVAVGTSAVLPPVGFLYRVIEFKAFCPFHQLLVQFIHLNPLTALNLLN